MYSLLQKTTFLKSPNAQWHPQKRWRETHSFILLKHSELMQLVLTGNDDDDDDNDNDDDDVGDGDDKRWRDRRLTDVHRSTEVVHVRDEDVFSAVVNEVFQEARVVEALIHVSVTRRIPTVVVVTVKMVMITTMSLRWWW